MNQLANKMKKYILLVLLLMTFLPLKAQQNGKALAANYKPIGSNSTIDTESLKLISSKEVLITLIKNDEVLNSRHADRIMEVLETMYVAGSKPVIWLTSKGPKSILTEANRQIQSSNAHGLNPARYASQWFDKTYAKVNSGNYNAEELEAINLNLTANYLLFNYDLIKGRINPDKLSGYWVKDKRQVKLLQRLSASKTSKKLRSHLKRITPKGKKYTQLQREYQFYENLDDEGGWPEIVLPENTAIEPAESHELIPAIRKRLSITDMYYTVKRKRPALTLTLIDSTLYDEKLISSVKRFQERHGLEVDGIIGKSTVTAMNISARRKADIIALNMERMRWMPTNVGQHFIEVNIPEYKLRVYNKKKKALEMKVIVGKEYTSTPVFSDTLKYLVLSPTWTVPMSIKAYEMLPKLKEEPTYYTKKNYKFYKGWNTSNEVNPATIDWSQYNGKDFPFNVVQQPGPTNSLGLVKFIMPNDMSIYLHDTPTDYLFERTERAFSHGCIRLEKPEVLANYLLRDQKNWGSARINEFLHKPSPEKVYLEKDYHVQLAYFTAFVDEKGTMNFRDDIYGHDDQQLKELKAIHSDLEIQ